MRLVATAVDTKYTLEETAPLLQSLSSLQD